MHKGCMKSLKMWKKTTRSITVQESTYERFRKLGNLSQTYDSVLNALLDFGEQKLLEQREEARFTNTQK